MSLSEKEKELVKLGFEVTRNNGITTVHDPVDSDGFHLSGEAEDDVIGEAYQHLCVDTQ